MKDTQKVTSEAKIISFDYLQTPLKTTSKVETGACGGIIDLVPESDAVDVSFFNNYLDRILNGNRIARATRLNPDEEDGIKVCWYDIIIQNDTRTEHSCAADGQFTVILRRGIVYGGRRHELTRAIQSDGQGNIMGRTELAELTEDARLKRPSDLVLRNILGRGYFNNTKRRDELIESFGLKEMLSPYDIDDGPVGITDDPNSAEISEILKIIARLNREDAFEYSN